MYNDNRQHRKWIAAGYAFAMTINVTRHAPKLSLRGETLVSTRQSMCALATVVFDMWIATGAAHLRDDDQSDVACPKIVIARSL